MIVVNRLNSEKFYINCDHIEFIEETPDTVISLRSGRKVLVAQSAQEVISKIIEFRREIYIKLPEIGVRQERPLVE